MKKEKNKLNLFVSIAPAHNGNFEQIVDIGDHKGLNILINAGNYPFNNKFWDIVIDGTEKMGNPSGGILQKTKFQYRKLRAYKEIIAESQKIIPKVKFKLFYCNLEDILNNFFFFKFRSGLIEERILVEDGILNYYDYKIDKSRRNTFYLKKITSLVLGIPYKIIDGQLSGIDMPIVKQQYVKYPSNAIFPEKALGLPIKKINYLPKPQIILFIGQDILEDILGIEGYLSKANEIIQDIEKVKEEEDIIVYKPHRNGDYRLVANLLSESFKNNYELVLDNTPVEKLIEEIKPQIIFSFYSTALLNIKMSLPKNSSVEIYSKPLSSLDERIKKLFIDSGIKILK